MKTKFLVGADDLELKVLPEKRDVRLTVRDERGEAIVSLELGLQPEVWMGLMDTNSPISLDASLLTPHQQALHRVAMQVVNAVAAWGHGISLWNQGRFFIEPEFNYYEVVEKLERALNEALALVG